MNWEALQGIAESVGAIGVIGSLVYLATQIRQNTRSVRAAASQDLLTSQSSILDFAKNSEYGAGVYDAFIRGDLTSLSSAERSSVRVVAVQLLRLFEQAYLQRRAGFLDDDVWHGWEHNMRIAAGTAGIAQGWSVLRPTVHPGFVELMETLGRTAAGTTADYLEHWESGSVVPGGTDQAGGGDGREATDALS